MAVATVLSYGVIDGASSNSKVLASITPGTDCALVAFVGGMFSSGSGGGIASVTSSGSGPSWTERADNWPDANYTASTAIYTATVGGSSPGTFDVTVTSGGRAFDWFYYVIYKVTGHDTSTTFAGAVATAGTADGASTITLSASPASDDVTLAFNWVDTDNTIGATFGSTYGTWTEDVDASGGATGGGHAANAGQRTGSTSTSVEWSDVAAGSGGNYWSGSQCAIIVKAAPSAPTGTGTPTDVRDTASGSASTVAPTFIPQNLVATTIDDDSIGLTWDAVAGISDYDIERDGTVIVFDHPTNSYTDTGLDPSTEYTYRVRSVL